MKAFQKRAMALSIAAIACGATTNVFAESDNDFAIEEIIVTAQKRAESVQDVAAAISAVGGSKLDEMGITDAESLVLAVPGMHFSQSGSNTRITVRGIGSEQTTVTGDPGVAFHIDGVYQTRASAGSALFYDLDRVEVLRGPQGTLYGRNATGGSVNLISNRPTQEFEGNVEVQLGDYNHQRLRGVVNAPLIDDKLAMRVSAQQETRDGYYENLTPGADDLEDRDALNLRTQFLYTPTETLDVLLSMNYSNDKGAGNGSKPLGDYPSPPGNINAFYAGATENPDDPWKVRTNGQDKRDNKRKGASITVDWDLGNVALKSISAWQENTVDTFVDADFSDVEIINENTFQENTQYSQELQLTSVDAGDWEWVAGLYWLQEENDVDYWLNDNGTGLSSILIPAGPLAGLPLYSTVDVGLDDPAYFGNRSNVKGNSLGAFGQVSYHINEDVKVTGGLRYSKDEKEASIYRKEFGPAPIAPASSFKKKDDWSSVTWKLGVDWQVAEDSLLYATVSTGFKSGGFLQIEDADSYDEEEVLAWEIGSKNRFFDNRLQANISAFYYEYTDMQLRTIVGTDSIVTNAGEAGIQGLEVELLARPMEGLQLSAALAWTDAEFDEYFDDDPHDGLNSLLDLSGNDLARSPDYTASLNAAYTWDLPWGSLTSSVNYYWSDEVYFSAYNRKDRDYQDSYHKTDINVTFNSLDDVWYATLSVQNLENAEVASNINLDNPTLGGIDYVQWQAPQTVRVSLGYNF
ncbi:TonB-dependent receptor [Maricurvus nonylphenolicus]|uniref:TonB-dependent receptor n=1 Tax=Maricurvus nonylphenolicus TaxID=1008307 RepID=UPI0036F2D069